jgi:transposase
MREGHLPMLNKHRLQKKAGKPEKALSYIAKLYGIEKQAKNLTAQARQQLRKQQAEPILNLFHA